jgi:arginyl-tRNA--protein-N-Asp/Glu arginylyltransferase
VSSVYFIWDPGYAWASLGKVSAMREIALVRDMRAAGAMDMGWVYMGEQGMRQQEWSLRRRLLDPGVWENAV